MAGLIIETPHFMGFETSILDNRQYSSYTDLLDSLSSSVTSTVSSITDSRLKVSNLLNQDLILPTNFKNLSESIYWGSAFSRTKIALEKIIDGYPIGISGSTTSSLYLEDIENANGFIANLSNYEWWVMRQLCGETLTTSDMTFTASATGILTSLSASVISSDPTVVIPVLIRDSNNYVLPPQGVHSKILLDDYYQTLLAQDTDAAIANTDNLSNFEQVLTTAIAFDSGASFVLKNGWGGTGDHNFTFETYNGLLETMEVPSVFLLKQNRMSNLQGLVSPILFQNDTQNVMERLLESFAVMFDDVKLYIDGLKSLFKNYWANWDNLPKGYIQQLVAHQYGIELFSSENAEIVDDLSIRGTYKSQKEITFEFWNRILCSLTYILKTKGMIDSIKAAARAYGFPSNFIEVYELESYKSFINGFYASPVNHAVARFRRTADANNGNAFTSVSANLALTSQTIGVHTKMKFFDDINLSTMYGMSGVVYSIAPSQLSLSYQYKTDTSVSTSGFPYISFSLSSGASVLTTDYQFINQISQQQVDGYWTVYSGRDHNNLYIEVGFVPSNYEYSEPVTNSVSAYYNALSTNSVATSITVGSDTNPPSINLSNVYVQNIGYSENHFNNLVLNSQFLSTPSGYDNNVVAWKFNEYVTLQDAGKNYILDAGPSGITGSPNFVFGGVGIPYDYEYDMPSFYNDNIPGFRNQKIGDLRNESLRDKNIRVGISLASPINTYIHTTFGSRFGELFANPEDVYASSITSQSQHYTYSLADTRTNEMYSVVGTSRGDVRLGEFLKLLNRVNGHLGSFFEFIEQIIPVSKRILEKGLIIENSINNRIILKKSILGVEDDFVDNVPLNGSITATVNTHVVTNVPLRVNDNVSVDSNIRSLPIKLDAGISGFGSVLRFDVIGGTSRIGLNVFPENNLLGSLASQYNAYLNVSVTGGCTNGMVLSGTMSAHTYSTNTSLPLPQFDYMPQHVLNDSTRTYLKERDELDNRRDNLTYQIPMNSASSNSYFLHVVQDAAQILLSTSITADQSLKRTTGHIFILDEYGRKVQTNYNAIRVNLNDCNVNGLNCVNVIVDGQYVPWNSGSMDFPILSASGATFEINAIGVPLDGTNPNKKVLVNFSNLLNPVENDQLLTFFLSSSMEDFSSAMGYTIDQSA